MTNRLTGRSLWNYQSSWSFHQKSTQENYEWAYLYDVKVGRKLFLWLCRPCQLHLQMPSWPRMFGIYPERKLVALLEWLGCSCRRCASIIHSWWTCNWTNQHQMPPILVLVSSWIWFDGPSSWVDSGCPGCLRWVFSWCSMLSTKEMASWTQQTMMMEMTPTKSPSTIEKTRSMRGKMTEMIWTPTKWRLWMDFFFSTLRPWVTVLFFSGSHLLWGGCDFLRHGFINKCFLEMRMFDVAGLVLFEINRVELRKSSSINSYVKLPFSMFS